MKKTKLIFSRYIYHSSIKVVLINIKLMTKVIENATIQGDAFDLVSVVCKYSATNKTKQVIILFVCMYVSRLSKYLIDFTQVIKVLNYSATM